MVALAVLFLSGVVVMPEPDAVRSADGLARAAIARSLRAMGVEAVQVSEAAVRGFEIIEARQDWKRPTRDRCCHTLTPIRIGSRRFAKGIGAHANGRILVELHKPYQKFTAFVGIDNNWDTRGERGSAVFIAKVDGREVARTPVCCGGDEPRWIEVPLTGARRLELIVADAGDGISYDQADWADAKLHAPDGSVEYLSDGLPAAAFSFARGPLTAFRYGGQLCWEIFDRWQKTEAQPIDGDGWRRYRVTWTAPSGFSATLTATVYDDPPAVELLWSFANRGGESELITDLNALDVAWPAAENACQLVWSTGGLTGTFNRPGEPVGFELKRAWLGRQVLGVRGGRSSNGDLPFFLVRDTQADWGLAVGLGWSGQWHAVAEYAERDGRVRLSAGIQPVHFRCPPGDQFRTCAALLVPFSGPEENGANRLRRLLRRHYQARLAGRPVPPPVSFNSWFVFHNDVNEELLRQLAEAAAEVGIEYFCLDAGWFVGGFPDGVGNWEVDRQKFPRGLKPVADYVHSLGMKFGLWFEPERVTASTRWWQEHSGLILGWRKAPSGARGVLDLARPEARRLVVETLSTIISEVGVDWIRYDFNIDPLEFWENAEDQDHRGLAQIRYINGLYEVLDELMRRHPGLFIEQCSSGGRRIDLETIRRGHTFWKSDNTHDQDLMRFHETGGNFFLPGGLLNTNLLEYRSAGEIIALFGGPLGFGLDLRRLTGEQKGVLRDLIGAYKDLRRYLNGDFYALFPQDRTGQMWNGWQFIDPDGEEGFFVVYRPPGSPYGSARVALRGPDGAVRYRLVNALDGRGREASGAELGRGWDIELVPDAAEVWRFAKIR